VTGGIESEVLFSKKELETILATAIEKLSPVHKTLITLYHQEELTYIEIAQITGLPEGTVKSYLFRARKQLKDNLLNQYKKEEL
jgi:RNA polymerase sigma-70 factor (ECF subfamily)